MVKVKKKLCFVIMPFSATKRCTTEEWTAIFENLHKPAIIGSRLGYKCERSKIRTGAFIKDILMQLNQADVVLADLTDMNPNVFYELGVRHTLRTRTILVSQTIDDVPSDLKQYGVITYNITPSGVTEYKNEISKILKDIRNNPDRPDNPVSDYLNLKKIVTDPFEAKTTEKKIIALVSECSYNLSVISSALEIADPNKRAITSARFRMGALELLTSTYYIYPTDDYIKSANDLLFSLTMQNSRLDLLKHEKFRNPVKDTISETYPNIEKSLEYFMQQTYGILKSFRNQNFVEPVELAICIKDKEHKEILEI
uniref:Uncharacterized protein n=1 Tax=Candidatus Methanophaga sp. ANME-1 ERB7 TaxID=2759913 RepID=A0A7G9Z4M9_9EURY|nr:hypothetical protein MHJDHPNH_00015 [Methanosarcinales archaeon ANME-1 ERB7]